MNQHQKNWLLLSIDMIEKSVNRLNLKIIEVDTEANALNDDVLAGDFLCDDRKEPSSTVLFEKVHKTMKLVEKLDTTEIRSLLSQLRREVEKLP